MLTQLAAIAFDPTIRGILVVVTGVVVLMGSIFLILGTNHGFRLGFLIAGAGLFGWCFLMGIVWWIYGIGLKGADPSWTPIEINYNRESIAATEELHKLPSAEELDSTLDPVETIDKYPLVKLAALGVEGADWQPETLTDVLTQATPLLYGRGDDLQAAMQSAIGGEGAEWADANPELAPIVNGSLADLEAAVHEQAQGLRDQIIDPLQGWCLLSESDSRRGDASAAVDAELTLEEVFGQPTVAADYTTENVFFYGGKENCQPVEEKSLVSRAWHRIATTFEMKNPRLLAAITVQENIEQAHAVGEAAPVPKVDESASVVTVVMERNLGNKRFIPFLFTLANAVIFAVFALALHSRDRRQQAMEAAYKGK